MRQWINLTNSKLLENFEKVGNKTLLSLHPEKWHDGEWIISDSKNIYKYCKSFDEAAAILDEELSKRGLKNTLNDSTVTLLDLYTPRELMDTTEILHDYAPSMDWETPLNVSEMAWEKVYELKNIGGDKIFDTFRDHATGAQKKIVAKKTKSFDANRIVVLSGDYVIDGNHHVIAAIIGKRTILYIDLADLD